MECTLFTTYFVYYAFLGQEYLTKICTIQRNPILRGIKSAHIFKLYMQKYLHKIKVAHNATLIALAPKCNCMFTNITFKPLIIIALNTST